MPALNGAGENVLWTLLLLTLAPVEMEGRGAIGWTPFRRISSGLLVSAATSRDSG